jgi:hypothetical protein
MVIYPDLGRSMMQKIETDHKFKTSLLGIYKAVSRLTELREVMKVYNLSPELPPIWRESPYMIRFNTVKQARMAAYVETLERAMKDKMRKELDRDSPTQNKIRESGRRPGRRRRRGSSIWGPPRRRKSPPSETTPLRSA